jgi:RNA polymerase sigma-70 factor (ECF subfamily)
MLRAWRGIDRFQPRAPLRSWLYRIATNVCLRMLEQRARDPGAAVDAHLEPYPDLLLDDVATPAAGPEETVEERERIAFVAAMQLLPPKQRVTVVLRDVLDWSAREVAELLDDRARQLRLLQRHALRSRRGRVSRMAAVAPRCRARGSRLAGQRAGDAARFPRARRRHRGAR